jgi:hypothetical protein
MSRPDASGRLFLQVMYPGKNNFHFQKLFTLPPLCKPLKPYLVSAADIPALLSCH